MSVLDGETMQVFPVLLWQVPTVQVNDVAAGLQVAVRVDVPFLSIVAGTALKEQIGALTDLPVPLKVKLFGLPVALLVIVITPYEFPLVVGVKVTLISFLKYFIFGR